MSGLGFNPFTDIGAGVYDWLHPAEAVIAAKTAQGVPLTEADLAALAAEGQATVPLDQYSDTLNTINQILGWIPYVLIGGAVLYVAGPTIATLIKK